MSRHHFWKNAFSALVFAVGFSTFLFSPSSVKAQPDVTDSDHPPGYDGFQFDPPFDNNNPFDKDTLEMVDAGRDLFMNETFGGNGRTCGTCHIPTAHYTITPSDIQKLTPAEKALVMAGTNTQLENPELVNEFALFNVNTHFGAGTEGNIAAPDGPFRASMPLLENGLGLTTINFHVCRTTNFTECNTSFTTTGLAPNPDFPGCTAPLDVSNTIQACVETVPFLLAKPLNRILPNTNVIVEDGLRAVMLGWAGTGPLIEYQDPSTSEGFGGDPDAINDCKDIIEEFTDLTHPENITNLDLGLATFSLEAVRTHLTKSQDRVPGEDFDCPTRAQLIDMSKFQEWLGRRYELDITKLDFATSVGNDGRDLFLNRNAGCSGCHINAGANDNQGRLKLGPFAVIPPLTNDQELLSNADVYECAEEVDCLTGEPPAPDDTACELRDDDYTCEDDVSSENYGFCVGGDGNRILVDDLLDALDELMPRSGMGANKTSRSGVQILEPLIDSQVAAAFPFDQGDGQLRNNVVNGHRQGGMNVQPAFPAVVKTDFFHNNAIHGKVEDAIAQVYFTDVFESSGGGAAITNGFRCGKSGEEALAALGGPEAIDKIGYFLRSLFAVYVLSDCERFMDEAGDRMEDGLPLDLPLTHCQFELNDLQTALKGSNINTNNNSTVLSRAKSISGKLTKILNKMKNVTNGSQKKQDKMTSSISADLQTIREDLVDMRHSIATTEEIED
jgi:hypothetical protein